MKKYNVMGIEMVRFDDLCYILRRAREHIDALYARRGEEEKKGMHEMCDSIVRHIFIEEIRQAESRDDVDAILEIPGDFILARRDGRKCSYFGLWEKGEAVITDKAGEAMHFLYEGMAQKTAERLGEGWMVLDTCPEACADAKRLLAAIFAEDD